MAASGISVAAHRIELDYDDDGFLVALRYSGGSHIDVETEHGLITELRLRMPDGEPAHVLVRYTYDEAGHLVGVVNSSGLPLRFAYDEGGRMLRWEALPLVIQRTHRSFYRAGRWFGPTWSSTLDHRLEIDEAGVCYDRRRRPAQ